MLSKQILSSSILIAMRFVLLTALCFGATTWAQLSSVTSFLATEGPIAKVGLLANIGGSGSKSAGVKACLFKNQLLV